MNAIAITFATLLAVANAGHLGAPVAIVQPKLTLATPSIAYSSSVVHRGAPLIPAAPAAKLVHVGRGIVGAPAVLAAPSITYSSGVVHGAPAPLAYAAAPALVHAPFALASAPLAVKSIGHGPLHL